MHALSVRQDRSQRPITLLYVKSITSIYAIGEIFRVARAYSPCLLILEDIDTLVSGGFQSYFFNEVDGLGNNDGIMMIATTNHLERLDGGLANRPSRFDRKYNFPDPSYNERILYCEFWRKKLENKAVEFPEELDPEIAKITQDFSFAYMKEAFIATLLAMARVEQNTQEDDGKDIHDLPFWKEMQKQVKILRDEMKGKHVGPRPPPRAVKPSNNYHQEAQAAHRNILQPVGGAAGVESPLPFPLMEYTSAPATNNPRDPPMTFPDLQPLSAGPSLPSQSVYGPLPFMPATKPASPFQETAAAELHHRLEAFDSTTGFGEPSSAPVVHELPLRPFQATIQDDGVFAKHLEGNAPMSDLLKTRTSIGTMQEPLANASNQSLWTYQMQLMQGSGATAGNHALQDYQMQLMLLERQNKKRLLMATRQQDAITTGPMSGQPADIQLPGIFPCGTSILRSFSK